MMTAQRPMKYTHTMSKANDAKDKKQQEAEKLVDFIVASDALDGVVTPPEEKAELIALAGGKAAPVGADSTSDEQGYPSKKIRYEQSTEDTPQPHPKYRPFSK